MNPKPIEKLCRHCRYSEGEIGGLWCWLHGKEVQVACDSWEREPGADDEVEDD